MCPDSGAGSSFEDLLKPCKVEVDGCLLALRTHSLHAQVISTGHIHGTLHRIKEAFGINSKEAMKGPRAHGRVSEWEVNEYETYTGTHAVLQRFRCSCTIADIVDILRRGPATEHGYCLCRTGRLVGSFVTIHSLAKGRNNTVYTRTSAFPDFQFFYVHLFTSLSPPPKSLYHRYTGKG